jgi:hypothetical protein
MDIERVLKDDRTSQASIGLTKAVFEQLIPVFEKGLVKCTKKNHYRGGRKDSLKTSRERLFFILFYLKNYPTYDVLGMQFGIHRSNAFRKVTRYMEALRIALKSTGSLPAESIGELTARLKDIKLVIVDGTEQRKNRPKDSKKQKDYYSGKKNTIR